MAFYSVDGMQLNIQEFVNLYSSGYFLTNNKIDGIRYTQGSEFVETMVLNSLENHFEDYSDIARAMAWKMGRIKHRDSEDQQAFVYTADWDACEISNPQRYGRTIDLFRMATYILENRDVLENLAQNNPQECLQTLRDIDVTGVGTVYLITLLFFLSHGECPIYDKFAMKALVAYHQNVKPGKTKLAVSSMPGKWNESFNNIVDLEYGDYIARLEALNADFRNNRNVDRALWIYGHAF